MGGLLKATAVLSTVSTLSALAFLLGLLGPVGRIAQSGFFNMQSYGFLLSLGLAAGFLISGTIVRAVGRRTVPETKVEASTSVPVEEEAV